MLVLRAEKVVKVLNPGGACPTRALCGVDLQILAGEFVGIMGPSGSGKTTLLNILSGIDRATSGTVEIGGKDIGRMSDSELALFRRRRLGIVFQDFNLLDSLTIRENVMLPMILEKKEAGPMDAEARAVMESFDILDIADKYPYEISGGQQQRAAVSRALVHDPEVILADEPTGNLDSRSSTAVMRCLARLHGDQRTILMVTHDPFAASFCSRVVFIRDGLVDGEISRDGSRREFLSRILQGVQAIGGEEDDV